MHIQRIAVKNFRKLHDLEVEDLEEGLTVIVGDNEEGKSTMLKALQAAFFERHKITGKPAKEMLPFGSKVRPEIEVDFEANGVSYCLKKAFKQSSSALLESYSQRWQGDAAEEKLREILGFTSPKRGAAKNEHRGLSGLLWVEQGRAFNPLEFNSDTHSSILEAIEGEVRQVTGGERGRKLLGAIGKRYSEYYTPTGKEKDKLKDARAEVEALRQEIGELEDKLSQYEGKVDRLDDLRKKLDRYEEENTLEYAEEEAKEAVKAERELEETEKEFEIASAVLDAADKSLEVSVKERAERNRKIERLEKSKSELYSIGELLERVEEERKEAAAAQSLAEGSLQNARRDYEETRRSRIEAQRKLKRVEALDSLNKLTEKRDRSQRVREELDEHKMSMAAIRIEEEDLISLRRKADELARRRAISDAVATTIEFSPTGPLGGQSVSANGEVIDVSEPYKIKERTSLNLEGFGGMVVTPGGEDIRLSREAVRNLQSDFNSSLSAFAYSSLSKAEEDFRRKNELRVEVEKSQARLDEIVPEGLEQLEDDIKVQYGVLASSTLDGEQPPLSLEVARAREVARAAEESARSAEEAAEKARVSAEKILEAENKKLSGVNEEWVKRKTSFENTSRDTANLDAEIAAERAGKPDERLREELSKAERERERREEALNELKSQLEEMLPELIRSERERTQDVLSNLKQQIDREQRQSDDLKIELRTLGQIGLGEALDEKISEHTQAQQELERLEQDADAWKLLKETLEAAEKEAKEAFIAPVTERLQPYMKYVLPRASLNLDTESLAIDSLQRDGVEEPFQDLSVGTREQIAVLARLALAEILLEDGRPVAVILDDPLVNSDDKRFRLMSAALREAAEKMQILILTCHEQRHQSLGATMVQLQDCY